MATQNQLEEALDLLEEIYEDDGLAPHRRDDGYMYHSSARLFVFMDGLGYLVDPQDLKDAKARMAEE